MIDNMPMNFPEFMAELCYQITVRLTAVQYSLEGENIESAKDQLEDLMDLLAENGLFGESLEEDTPPNKSGGFRFL